MSIDRDGPGGCEYVLWLEGRNRECQGSDTQMAIGAGPSSRGHRIADRWVDEGRRGG